MMKMMEMMKVMETPDMAEVAHRTTTSGVLAFLTAKMEVKK